MKKTKNVRKDVTQNQHTWFCDMDVRRDRRNVEKKLKKGLDERMVVYVTMKVRTVKHLTRKHASRKRDTLSFEY